MTSDLWRMSPSCEAVSCSIKPPVHLYVGRSHAARSGVCVVDISLPFGKPVNIEKITFKNFYTASLSLRLLRKEPHTHTHTQWVTAVRTLSLMDNPHTEGGAQDYCSLHRTQMLVDPDHVVLLRLILRQPSSAWITFNLEDIKVFPHTEMDSKTKVSDWLSDLTLVDQHPDKEDLPDSRSVSCSIQQMLALTEVMKNNQTSSSIGRYQVDGCYDVNLLSL